MTNQSAVMDYRGNPNAATEAQNKWLFWACFISLIATSVAFVTRFSLLNAWGKQFNLSGEQLGQIGGAGVWPFAISIILFSLVVDRIGYGVAMAFAFFSHIAYGVIVICAPMFDRETAYWMLYGGSFILGLSNGTIEAVINPVVATMFNKDKVKWLNILHAGWPAGLVGGGLLGIALGGLDWRWTIGMIFLPALVYGPMMLRAKFPVNERVAAGGSYMGMLKEFGFLAALIVTALVMRQVGVVFGMSDNAQLITTAIIVVGFGAYVRSPGRIMLIVLMLIMMPLATTELGTDGWITAIMEEPLKKIGLHGLWVLVYTSFIMMMLRAFAAGPIVHKLKPLGLLAMSSAIAAGGLLLLSMSVGWAIFAAATFYALGKTFFWPTMLGVVSEQCPKGGALTLNAVGGMGMLAVGVLGDPFIGLAQDNAIMRQLKSEQPAIYQVVKVEKHGMYGAYEAVNEDMKKTLTDEQKENLDRIMAKGKHSALATMAIFPCVMLGAYLLMILYFASRGGYKPVELVADKSGAAH